MQEPKTMDRTEWGLLVLLSVLWGGAFFCVGVRAGGSNVMLVTLLIPVTALLLGNLFLSEPIVLYEVAGAATIGLGLLFIDGRLPRRAMRVTATRVTAGRRRR